jgi:hypothetical protein
LDNLNIAQEHELTIKKLTNEQNQIGLEIRRGENEITIESVENKGLEIMAGEKHLSQLFQISDAKKASMQQDLKSAALSGQSAIQAMKSVVRAETMEAVAGYLSSVLKTVPFPANILLAAGGGGLVAGLMDKALGSIPNKFATGADFITSGPTPMLVGESGAERVSVTPLQGPNINGPQGGMTINFNNAIMSSDFTRDQIIPQIEQAVRMNLA